MWTLRGRFNRVFFVKNKFWVSKKETAISKGVSRQINFTPGQVVTVLRGNPKTRKALGSGDLSLLHCWETTP